MKAILVNAKEKTISEVNYSGDWRDISKLCGYQWFGCIGVGKSNTLYADADGLVNGTDFGFTLKGYGKVLGNALLLGNDDIGDTTYSVEDVRKIVKF